MEIPPSQEEDMPVPINSTYGRGGHGHGHGHMIHGHGHVDDDVDDVTPSNNNHIITSVAAAEVVNSLNGPATIEATPVASDHHVPFKKMVRYKECLKNHAAPMGGNATDGCGEFMPSGEEGSLEALICSACNCHRNFHRKEIEGETPPHTPSSCDWYHHHHHLNRVGRKFFLGHQNNHKAILGPHESFVGYHPTGNIIPSRVAPPAAPAPPHHQMLMSYNMSHESEDHEDMALALAARPIHHHHDVVKKRYRTKFTQEQKEKMLSFAEKVGWKIQRQEESVVQQFCQEIGVKRRVLKVWMHNNKHNLAKKNSNNIVPQNQV